VSTVLSGDSDLQLTLNQKPHGSADEDLIAFHGQHSRIGLGLVEKGEGTGRWKGIEREN